MNVIPHIIHDPQSSTEQNKSFYFKLHKDKSDDDQEKIDELKCKISQIKDIGMYNDNTAQNEYNEAVCSVFKQRLDLWGKLVNSARQKLDKLVFPSSDHHALRDLNTFIECRHYFTGLTEVMFPPNTPHEVHHLLSYVKSCQQPYFHNMNFQFAHIEDLSKLEDLVVELRDKCYEGVHGYRPWKADEIDKYIQLLQAKVPAFSTTDQAKATLIDNLNMYNSVTVQNLAVLHHGLQILLYYLRNHHLGSGNNTSTSSPPTLGSILTIKHHSKREFEVMVDFSQVAVTPDTYELHIPKAGFTHRRVTGGYMQIYLTKGTPGISQETDIHTLRKEDDDIYLTKEVFRVMQNMCHNLDTWLMRIVVDMDLSAPTVNNPREHSLNKYVLTHDLEMVPYIENHFEMYHIPPMSLELAGGNNHDYVQNLPQYYLITPEFNYKDVDNKYFKGQVKLPDIFNEVYLWNLLHNISNQTRFQPRKLLVTRGQSWRDYMANSKLRLQHYSKYNMCFVSIDDGNEFSAILIRYTSLFRDYKAQDMYMTKKLFHWHKKQALPYHNHRGNNQQRRRRSQDDDDDDSNDLPEATPVPVFDVRHGGGGNNSGGGGNSAKGGAKGGNNYNNNTKNKSISHPDNVRAASQNVVVKRKMTKDESIRRAAEQLLPLHVDPSMRPADHDHGPLNWRDPALRNAKFRINDRFYALLTEKDQHGKHTMDAMIINKRAMDLASRHRMYDDVDKRTLEEVTRDMLALSHSSNNQFPHFHHHNHHSAQNQAAGGGGTGSVLQKLQSVWRQLNADIDASSSSSKKELNRIQKSGTSKIDNKIARLSDLQDNHASKDSMFLQGKNSGKAWRNGAKNFKRFQGAQHDDDDDSNSYNNNNPAPITHRHGFNFKVYLQPTPNPTNVEPRRIERVPDDAVIDDDMKAWVKLYQELHEHRMHVQANLYAKIHTKYGITMTQCMPYVALLADGNKGLERFVLSRFPDMHEEYVDMWDAKIRELLSRPGNQSEFFVLKVAAKQPHDMRTFWYRDFGFCSTGICMFYDKKYAEKFKLPVSADEIFLTDLPLLVRREFVACSMVYIFFKDLVAKRYQNKPLEDLKKKLVSIICAVINSTIFANPYIPLTLFVHVVDHLSMVYPTDSRKSDFFNDGDIMDRHLKFAYDLFFAFHKSKNYQQGVIKHTHHILEKHGIVTQLDLLPYKCFRPMYNVYFARRWDVKWDAYHFVKSDYGMYKHGPGAHTAYEQQYEFFEPDKYAFPLDLFGTKVDKAWYPRHFSLNPDLIQRTGEIDSVSIDNPNIPIPLSPAAQEDAEEAWEGYVEHQESELGLLHHHHHHHDHQHHHHGGKSDGDGNGGGADGEDKDELYEELWENRKETNQNNLPAPPSHQQPAGAAGGGGDSEDSEDGDAAETVVVKHHEPPKKSKKQQEKEDREARWNKKQEKNKQDPFKALFSKAKSCS